MSNTEAAATPSSLHNEPVDEFQRLTMTAQDALTDSIVERLATSTANVLEIADRLNDEETRDAIHAVVDNLTELHRIGALDTMFQMVKLMHATRDAATDNIVERLFAFVENMLSNVATDEMAELIGNVTGAMDEALEASREGKKKGGIKQIYSVMKTPEGLRALKFIVAFVDRMHASTAGVEDAAS